ncbi:hypothetical protein [Burkholderia sp. BDU5]|uniref:Uncharacterized protein n=2 Tax=Burkholderia mayonis TaxID=1385591 RepID=A0A1B4FP23_9BURK|nr:hypothetical protein [Burkholderia sp. BDU5]AOJ05411.1 hypothetical protein WS70_27375 [Burkholderia mayonis]KVE42997.1 hypothetical protein WS69_24650 [Burkholderia sp. BDU5]KVE47876.1 hypothetical protein WS70_25385 [Burkholderia mayonis]
MMKNGCAALVRRVGTRGAQPMHGDAAKLRFMATWLSPFDGLRGGTAPFGSAFVSARGRFRVPNERASDSMGSSFNA